MCAKKIEIIEVLPKIRAPKKEVEAHEERLKREPERKEDEEWEISERTRGNIEERLEK